MTTISEMDTGKSVVFTAPKDRTNVVGWYAWDRGKYHAFLINHPKNSKTLVTGRVTIWSACNSQGINVLADFSLSPPIEKRCKNCLRELARVRPSVQTARES